MISFCVGIFILLHLLDCALVLGTLLESTMVLAMRALLSRFYCV
jgi:hypothetical protein